MGPPLAAPQKSDILQPTKMSLTKTDLDKIQKIVDETIDKRLIINNDSLMKYMRDTFVTKTEFNELKAGGHSLKLKVDDLSKVVYDIADIVAGTQKFLETEFVALRHKVFDNSGRIDRVETKLGIAK